jgi:hypothetical protein
MEQSDQSLDDARQAGIDLDLLDTNLALPIAERWRQHDAALELALKLEKAGMIRNAELQSASSTTH